MTAKPVALLILDGFGIADADPGNAITLANTPVLDGLFAQWPTGRLCASGTAVGLPEGQMGNSEVGHLNIGAGRVVHQELTRITQAIKDGSLYENKVLIQAIDAAVDKGRAVHLMGLLSDGGVHSHIEHLYALIEMAKRRGAVDVRIHCFLDGRDVPPDSGAGFLSDLQEYLDRGGVGRIATVVGRYYAMDRDNRWERVERAWRAIVLGDGATATDPVEAARASYALGLTDEFVEPIVISGGESVPVGVANGDAVVFFNFRPDRARQITRTFVDADFTHFDRPAVPHVHFVCLTEYDPTIHAAVAFAKSLPCCVLADVIAQANLRQLHIAETEKYAHVTFFLNGGQEVPKDGEERVLVPSPRVATYDLQPEMSAPEVTDALVAAITEGRADFYVVNYANCDMVGHTGVLSAAVAAVETVDECVGRVVKAIRGVGGSALITADHGNAERMLASDGESPFTAHTSGDVPLCVVSDNVVGIRSGGKLADVAPTVLALLGPEAPKEWTGENLLLY
ncbi:MAG: 2,3-bisphosphoglycerate-independent phosphoglycerate mutase [Actinomycetota bacterium]|jgi:2,3-bisphosphoglycerate-independent phosphoglycerate mutase|nr:2,3-bisphosphoglycerate-independent phosphoglycerate mutase [Actinomycetota bacterium]